MRKSAWTTEVQGREEQYRLKRLALLRTAAKAFNELGFHDTSLNDLAKRLNVTKPTLYYYVKNKEDILFECQRIALEQMKDTLEATRRNHHSVLEKIEQIMTRYAEVITDDFGRCLVLSRNQILSAESEDKLKVQHNNLNSAVLELITRGVEEGSIAPCDPKLATFALFGAFNWIAHWHKPGGTWEPREIAQSILQLFKSGLLPRAA
jgi:AcrR family transcriptional regulator